MEEWKDVCGYEGLYQVSNLGRVRSLDRRARTARGTRKVNGHVLATADNGRGYRYVTFSGGRKRENKYVHRMVAEAFVENPDNLPCVNHRDYDVTNNTPENLEWVTQGQNVRYSTSRMMHQKRPWRKSSTGEKYIYKREKGGKVRYRVSIDRKAFAFRKEGITTVEEAVKIRDDFLLSVGEVVIDG